MAIAMFLRIIGVFALLITESKQCELSTKYCSCGYIKSSLYVMCEMTPNNTVDIETALMQLENISRVQVEGGNFLPLLHKLNTSLSAVTDLDFSHNHQTKSIEQDTFKYCQKIEHIRLHDYNIISIEMGAFSYLQHLRILDLSDNSFLIFSSIFEGLMNLQSPNLKRLNISGTHKADDIPYADIEFWMFKQLENTTLEELDMSWTRILSFQTSAETVPYLKYADFSGTLLIGDGPCLSTFLSHKNIETLKLDHWPKMPLGIYSVDRLGQSSHLFKREESSECTSIQKDIFTREGCIILPEPMTTLYLRFIDADGLYLKMKDKTCFHTNNILTVVMSHMRISSTLGNMKGLHKLKTFDLSHPNIVQPVPAFSSEFFSDMPSLQVLLISGTGLHRIPLKELSQFFINNSNIVHIDISNNALEILPPSLIIRNTFLEVLNVSFNQLEVFQLDIYSNSRLKEIDLRYNNIRYFEENKLTTLSRFGKLVSVYLPTKSFYCDTWACKYEYLDLINVTFTCSKEVVAFLINNNQSKANVSLPSVCEPDMSKDNQLQVGWIIGIVCSIIIIMLIICIILVWLYRRNKPPDLHGITENNTYIADNNVFLTISGQTANYNRDPNFVAFLSYSHIDTDFVIQRIYKPLNKKLEIYLPQHNPYSLIIVNDRNFLPGEPIDQLIEEAVSNSCVTIAVVSNDFANSMWCHFEVLTALTANVPIIPIYLNKCDPSLLKGSLNVIYNSKVRLMWPDTSELDCQSVTSEEDKVIDVLVKSILRHIGSHGKGSISEQTLI